MEILLMVNTPTGTENQSSKRYIKLVVLKKSGKQSRKRRNFADKDSYKHYNNRTLIFKTKTSPRKINHIHATRKHLEMVWLFPVFPTSAIRVLQSPWNSFRYKITQIGKTPNALSESSRSFEVHPPLHSRSTTNFPWAAKVVMVYCVSVIRNNYICRKMHNPVGECIIKMVKILCFYFGPVPGSKVEANRWVVV